jgi:hypothetical protein
MSVVKEFDVDFDIISCRCGPRQGADAGSGTTSPADNSSELSRSDAHVEAGPITERSLGNRNLISLIHD